MAERVKDRSPNIGEGTFLHLLVQAKDRSTIFPDPDGEYMSRLSASQKPTLVVGSDHDIACPIENWYALSKVWKSMHILAVPQAGHAPHHQEPEFIASAIAAFVKRVR